ncbi:MULTISPECIES: dioxygenase family protein [Dyadobacter]|uniref:Intradiol ring-cleavage dioxygenase n=1 Tax=Dyadobacter chenhuakuii TaxID=2909339 RepID=A0A9X1QGW0_9BACT|nr:MULTISPECIES: intradiol ring-cleavage dioxygenase [Dyadobacter]MCF2501301.1 intradiol ring-cleavage dioxygenase [Dyadobacter chenhuakuii]MCF2502120.1 intradiol ring-cleavage dioxygenase [Dyadobacter fanqingshengii]
MNRLDFLKKGFNSLSVFAALPILEACKEDESAENVATNPTSANCAVTNSETPGPFPIRRPNDLIINNIVSDRAGIPLQINITIRNVNTNCEILPGVLVDIWQCDKDGYYSEYGGNGSQSVNLTDVHFLRGRQISDSAGLASWTSIFPGWYPGRAPHIHVHIYSPSGPSLLITQIAFPKEICDTVYRQGVYASHGLQDTSNERDMVFSDGIANEMGQISGSVANGFVLNHTINVRA